MEPINEVESVITPLNRKNVDTDQIISKEFLKRINDRIRKVLISSLAL